MAVLTESPERCFGDTETVAEMAQCLQQTGERLQKLKAEVVQEIQKRVPGSYDDDAARAFKEVMDRQMDAVLRLADGACFASQALKTLEVGLAKAKAKFQLAEQHASTRGCWIDGALFVHPYDETSEAGWIAAQEIQAEVREAQTMADLARQDATRHLERLDDLCMAIYDSMFPQPPMMAPGAMRRRPRGPRPPRPPRPPGRGHNLPWGPPPELGEIKPIRAYRKGLNQLNLRDAKGRDVLVTWTDDGRVHMQLFDTNAAGTRVIIKEGWIGKVDVPTGIPPGTTQMGNAMEPRVLDLMERVTGWDLKRFGPGYTGPDVVPK